MKNLYEAIADILLNDNDLKGLVQYNPKQGNIRRGYMPKDDWSKAVVFYLQPDFPLQNLTPMIRVAPLIVRVYDRENDLNCTDIGERVILLLDGSDLTVDEKVHCYDVSYTGEMIATSWNDTTKTFERILRFEIRYRIDDIIGSGRPTRRRMIDRT